MTTINDIEKVLSNACDCFRSKMSGVCRMSYIFALLFVKYLSDFVAEKSEWCIKNNKDNKYRAHDVLNRERFVLDDRIKFEYLYSNRNDVNIGQTINDLLNHIEELNKAKLSNIFRYIDFNSPINFGKLQEQKSTIRNLLEIFNDLDLRPSQIQSANVIGQACDNITATFAITSEKKGCEFFTPSQVSELIVSLVRPKETDLIYDPTCGSGSLLLKAYKKSSVGNSMLYGQELNSQIYALCRINMLLHGVDDFQVWNGDTLSSPMSIEGDDLMKFQVVVANPPFALNNWDKGFFIDEGESIVRNKRMSPALDRYHRFDLGVPPTSKGDFAFVLHMLASLDENGRMAIALPHGVLFRGASEREIRRKLLEKNLLDAVIALPANLFYGTSIPVCILVFKRNRTCRDVLFIDASSEMNFEKNTIKNILRKSAISRITDTYLTRKVEEKYSYVASFEEIKQKDFNLSIDRYVDTFDDESYVDIEELHRRAAILEKDLLQIQKHIRKYCEELEVAVV